MSGTSCRGLLLAAGIVLGWLLSLVALVALDALGLAGGLLAVAVMARTLAQTGLFIVGHDAMHGVLLPEHPRWNDRLGAASLGLYAALPYGRCHRNHLCHHREEATPGDPDFHPDPHAGPLRWYGRFMGGYLSSSQMARLLVGWMGLTVLLHSLAGLGWDRAAHSVLLCCTLPLLLSSLQLFLVGTYLPHRQQRSGSGGATSLDLPVWASLLACYHFGYHREHHEAPSVPWFALPRQRLASGDAGSVSLDTRNCSDRLP
ncbi:beta-carotene ketolase [Cyanobium sp. NS01]|nr:beta-carotene ketolase [Cyanobium sp. NS01]